MRIFLIALCVMLIALCSSSEAQQPVRILRIGMLFPGSASVYLTRLEAFRQRLRELGYVEGKNIVIEYRFAEGKRERLDDLAAELVRLKVDVIVIGGNPAPAKKASATIPIIFILASDPVGSGYVSSLARPGGNLTGLSVMAPDLDGKRLELVKEAFPKVALVAFLWESGGTRGNLPLTEMEAAAKALGLKVLSLPVRSLGDFDKAFARGKRERAEALIVTPGPLVITQQRELLDFAAKNRLPAMYPWSEFVEAGGLMSYAPNAGDLFWRTADFVEKILKGNKPADLPVEQPKKFEFIVNLQAAKQIGLTIPPDVLARADRVIR